MKAINIEWDVTDGDENMTEEEMDEVLATLPTEVEVPNYLAERYKGGLDEEISDWLSNRFGFCHYGFKLVK